MVRASLEHLGPAIDSAAADAVVVVVEVAPGVALASITRRASIDDHRDLVQAYENSVRLRAERGLSASSSIPVITVASCAEGVAVWPGLAERRAVPELLLNSPGGVS